MSFIFFGIAVGQFKSLKLMKILTLIYFHIKCIFNHRNDFNIDTLATQVGIL